MTLTLFNDVAPHLVLRIHRSTRTGQVSHDCCHRSTRIGRNRHTTHRTAVDPATPDRFVADNVAVLCCCDAGLDGAVAVSREEPDSSNS